MTQARVLVRVLLLLLLLLLLVRFGTPTIMHRASESKLQQQLNQKICDGCAAAGTELSMDAQAAGTMLSEVCRCESEQKCAELVKFGSAESTQTSWYHCLHGVSTSRCPAADTLSSPCQQQQQQGLGPPHLPASQAPSRACVVDTSS
jgi:hypothetical protein